MFVWVCSVQLQTVRLPFLQVIAGLGAPLVWQVNRALFPSVTVWSDGGDVNAGATPRTQCCDEWQKTRKWLLAKAKAKICSLITGIKSQYFIYSPFTHHPVLSEHKCGRPCCWSSVRTLNSTESDCNAGETNIIAQYDVHTVHLMRPKQCVKLTVTSVWI